jgi:hypothetical protein
MEIEFPLEKRVIYTRHGEALLWGTSSNPYLDSNAVEFLRECDDFMQGAIMLGEWEGRPGKAYRKHTVGGFGDRGLDIPKEPELQIAEAYFDPEIEIPGVPYHNHPDYSEFFGIPKGGGEGVLSLGLDEEEIGQEETLKHGNYFFIDGRVFHAARPADSDDNIYVAVLRFYPELVRGFGRTNRLHLKR